MAFPSRVFPLGLGQQPYRGERNRKSPTPHLLRVLSIERQLCLHQIRLANFTGNPKMDMNAWDQSRVDRAKHGAQPPVPKMSQWVDDQHTAAAGKRSRLNEH